MAQRIQCACGKTFKIPEKFAGKKIRCLACKQVLKLYQQQSSSDIKTVPEGTIITCAGCQTRYKGRAKICLKCGINLQTGAVVYSPNDGASSEELDWSSEENFLHRRGILQQLFDRLMGS
jgi:hypothetical protein